MSQQKKQQFVVMIERTTKKPSPKNKTSTESDDFRISLDQKCDICRRFMLGDEDVVPHPKEKYLWVHKFCSELYSD